MQTLIQGQEANKKLLTIASEVDLPILLVGETGTGKTSLVRELAEEVDRPYSRFSITGETTVDDFVGKYILRGGETVWQDGALLTAIKGGHYLVVDEINAALPEILFVLHSLLDDDKFVVIPQKDNSIVKPHKNFRFFATMNPVDEYAGTKELNKAFMSRFAMVLLVEFPDRQTETNVLIERTGVKSEDATRMVDVAIGVRQAKKQDKVFYTFSTRDLLFWGSLVDKLGLHQAFRVTIRNKGMEDADVLEQIYQKVFTDYRREETTTPNLTNLDFYKEERKKLEREKAKITKAKKEYKATAIEEAKKQVRSESKTLTQKIKQFEDIETRVIDKLQKQSGLNRSMVERYLQAEIIKGAGQNGNIKF